MRPRSERPSKRSRASAHGTLLDAAIAAARGAGSERVAVIGGAEVRAHCAGTVEAVVAESSDGRENLRRAFAEAGDAALLLLASDMPFVRAASVSGFFGGRARRRSRDAARRAPRRIAPRIPAHRRTTTNLAGERVVNGSVFYFGPGVAGRVLAVAQQLFAARKSSLGMARLLGAGIARMRFALGRLRVADVEARAQARLGLDARAVRDAAPDLCYDIDTVADYRYALDSCRARLTRRASARSMREFSSVWGALLAVSLQSRSIELARGNGLRAYAGSRRSER